jgi:hypothetical protein
VCVQGFDRTAVDAPKSKSVSPSLIKEIPFISPHLAYPPSKRDAIDAPTIATNPK